MNAGGAETFLMKLYRNLDRTRYQMDFCINVPDKCFYEDEILSMGGRIFRIPSKSEDMKGFARGLTDVIRKEGYESVLRITSSTMGLYDLKVAKKAGDKRLLARSSNSSDGGSLKAKLAHLIGKVLYRKYVTCAFAPSDLAAKYTFGEKAYRDGKVFILPNAVDLNVFSFSEEKRKAIREEFGIAENTKVIGHVGRFMAQKNHTFLAEIFKEMLALEEDSVLFLVGNGELQEKFEAKAKEIGIFDRVIFAGLRSDVPDLLSAMDVFVFPSLYEGMPNTVIEAQATGLPCVIADTITKEAKITDLVQHLPLEKPEIWADTALKAVYAERTDTTEELIQKGYEISSSAEKFVKLVFQD
jgi:glycosyltransferase involved in cell wall biosynthesis